MFDGAFDPQHLPNLQRIGRLVRLQPPRLALQRAGKNDLVTADEFGRYLNDDIVKWERIVKISGAKPDQ